ncbi:HAD family hydrolase [Falsihalocynthiibacter sp. SS001]|uniref:HAD family hydrolase n=1 Tax=Falsihalocynthiibacter sp. SS001 TaxID=3349698 RepID=UPI0036D41BE4
MKRKITTIAFDADDTLWHNETFFRITQERFADLLRDYTESEHLFERLLAAERRNLGHYGFGVKGFVLSMIETAIEVTEARVPATVIQELIQAGQDMLRHPIELLPHVEATLADFAENYEILLITKGDMLDQERKLAQSGLGELFDGVEIVSHKNEATYHEICQRRTVAPNELVMVGNSLKSDVLPVLAIGGWAAHVPHEMTWELERAKAPEAHTRFAEISDLSQLKNTVQSFEVL